MLEMEIESNKHRPRAGSYTRTGVRGVRLEWSAYAIEDRVAIFEYIEADNPWEPVGRR